MSRLLPAVYPVKKISEMTANQTDAVKIRSLANLLVFCAQPMY